MNPWQFLGHMERRDQSLPCSPEPSGTHTQALHFYMETRLTDT